MRSVRYRYKDRFFLFYSVLKKQLLYDNKGDGASLLQDAGVNITADDLII